MKILQNEKDFEDSYYDKKYLTQEKYPTSYPCIMETYTCGGGLMGEYTTHEFVYLPEDPHIADIFIKGYVKGQELMRQHDL